MSMLREVFGDDPEVIYGPSCKSGPLGGDAQRAVEDPPPLDEDAEGALDGHAIRAEGRGRHKAR